MKQDKEGYYIAESDSCRYVVHEDGSIQDSRRNYHAWSPARVDALGKAVIGLGAKSKVAALKIEALKKAMEDANERYREAYQAYQSAVNVPPQMLVDAGSANTYRAELNSSMKVTVGCRTFTLDEVNTLVTASQKMRRLKKSW